MTRLPNPFLHKLSRRSVMLGAAAAAITVLGSGSASAVSADEAKNLVDRTLAEINRVIASGKTGSSLYREFEDIFARYADVAVIARSVLGADWRRASDAQRRSFTTAFRGYLARKYGSQFRDYRSATINVRHAVPVNRYIEVRAESVQSGRSPIELTFLVADRGGAARFFDLRLQGVSLARTERGEIGAMLDQRRGNLDQLIAYLQASS